MNVMLAKALPATRRVAASVIQVRYLMEKVVAHVILKMVMHLMLIHVNYVQMKVK